MGERGVLGVGDVLDRRYRLVERLGRGGFGDVWRAEELLPDGAPFREVALKLLHVLAADVADWAEEAKLLASLRHPSLVTIYAAGILDVDPPQRFVAMELLEGHNLSDLARARGTIKWRRVLRWAATVASALDTIHERGVVHLDLKPANLFLTRDGALKVLDFGIARRAGARDLRVVRAEPGIEARPLSRREQEMPTVSFVAAEEAFAITRLVDSRDPSRQPLVIGTPGFMAPEILEQGEPTAAADAYALAVCIVQLATGHLPHAAPDEPPSWDDPTGVSGWLAELRAATLRGALKDFDAGETALPRGLVALLRRLLHVDPVQRGVTPGRLAELVEDVRQRPFGVPSPPYFGLDPLTTDAEGMLFGRDDDIARLGRDLEFEPSVVLQGARGAGKTSLARAGLVPHLAHRGVDGKDDWALVEVKPGPNPDAALDDALAAFAPELRGADVDALAAFAAASPTGLVISIDPLDDLLDAPARWMDRLGALIIAMAGGSARPGLRLLGVVGEDTTAALLEVEPFGPSLRASLRFVGAPSTAAVRDLVAAPAHFAGANVFAVEAVAADVGRELRADASRLPFVSLALRTFWGLREQADAPAVLRGERWIELGGIKGALARHADRVMATLVAQRRAIADEILVNLSATDGAKVTWDERELLAAAAGKAGTEEAEAVLAILARERLVVRRGGKVEIAHDALLTAWPHLSSVRLHNMERLVLIERLRDSAIAWERGDRNKELLLSPARLRELRENKASLERGLGERERDFVRESRRRDAVRVAIRVASVLFVLLAIAGGVAAKRAVDRAKLATEREMKIAAHHEYVSEMAARARRSDDPFHRAAYIAEAMSERSIDGLLPLDLAASAGNVPHAEFLTLDNVTGASFPWDDRWLVGTGSGGTITIVDFKSKEPEVIEGVDLDVDPETATTHRFKEPVVHELRPHEDPIVERTSFAFDTSFVTRSVSGEVRVFRLRDDGTFALAATAPMRCSGAVIAAAAAPVVACATDGGIARWDLRVRGAAAVSTRAFQGRVADVSADGERVIAALGKRVVIWSPREGIDVEHDCDEPVLFALTSPRDRVVALVKSGRYEIIDPRRPRDPLFEGASAGAPISARWDEGGMDLGVCGPNQSSVWHYLASGGRAKAHPPPHGSACSPAPASDKIPETLHGVRDYDEIADHELGPHTLNLGWKLSKHRFLTRDLVLFDGEAASAQNLLKFQGRDETGAEEDRLPHDSVVSTIRLGDAAVAWQIGADIHFYSLPEGKRVLTRKGNILRRCNDKRLLSWLADRETWILFDGWGGAQIAVLPREPGFIVGADGACTSVYTQRLDGTLVATAIEPGRTPASRAIAVADGYVYDTRVSPARGDAPAGVWLALSSGAIARVDDGSDRVRVYGYATPHATAIADGPAPNQVAYADATGLVLLDAKGSLDRLLEGASASPWEDISVAADGASVLLASGDRISVLDLGKREILGSVPNEGRSRFSPWDADGSVIAWSFDRAGGADGQVIPRGVGLARRVAQAVSNLEIERGKMALAGRSKRRAGAAPAAQPGN